MCSYLATLANKRILYYLAFACQENPELLIVRPYIQKLCVENHI
jgi:hypothetical protein